MSTDTQSEELDTELQRRAVYAALIPSVRLGRLFGISLKEAGEWLQLAYLKDLVDDGTKLNEAASILDVSVRTVSALSSKLRENFFAPEREYELPARILFALWVEPLSRKRVKQYLSGFKPDHVDAAIDQLEADGRIRLIEGRTPTYEVVEDAERLVRRDMMSRVDALNSLLGTVTDAVFSRFFADGQHAFARALQLRVRPQDLAELRELYDNTIWPTLKRLDEAAKGSDDAIEIGVGLSWAPLDIARKSATQINHTNDHENDQ